jgi:hypothetical protein
MVLNNLVMKKSNLLKKFFPIFLIMFLIACTKTNDMTAISPGKALPSEIVNDQSFEAFNNSTVRFDPLYLQIVYNDKRSKLMIQEQSTALIIALNKNPNNIPAQKELTRLYHFDTFLDLQKASEQISKTAIQFQQLHFAQHEKISIAQKQQILAARKKYVNNKIEIFEAASQKRTNGLWNDKVDETLLEFKYWLLVRNEELVLEDIGSSECTDACCYEYKACLTRAASAYRVNFLILGTTLGATGGSLGALYGSLIPLIGTIAIGTGGGIIGGVGGFIQAVNIFMKDQEACVYSYKACVIRQNQK